MALTSSKFLEAQSFGKKILKYLNNTGSPFHSVKQIIKYMSDHNVPITHLKESSPWNLEKGRCYCLANDSGTMMAFKIGKNFNPSKGGLILVASHTDSPCLKLDFKSHTSSKGFDQVNVCTYGGGLWHTWLDRELGVAGKVVVRSNNRLEERLIHVRNPLIIVPNLAIHLQSSQEREALKLNKQNHLRGIISTECVHKLNADETEPLLKFLAGKLNCTVEDIVDIDLCLMESTAATLSGVYEEFITSGRLDNLASCFASVAGFSDFILHPEGNDDSIVGIVAYNYEEIGSTLEYGANSEVTSNWLNKIFSTLGSKLQETSSRSLLISADMAHGVHPNYPEKHIDTHMPYFHKGVVIKRNVNGRYATDIKSSSIIKAVAEKVDVPLQDFRTGNDTPCGSTIGPYLSSRLCIPVVDVGIPQLAMHSIRETCSLVDVFDFYSLSKALFSSSNIIDSYNGYN
ncbi:conserved hypothetical protein [Theileria equi strain WA]|uniref:aspartyl aminopeptidase n=1 Tax=Theileria equi strain WA TaxID=1537102 RepID=L1LG11_THEEQ|nr:conserved hypothetical protein [Theileria equi strain WA]EKX74276.1 conserved hypothetical protein [Theileria equi strain WA]|eukprot:XP_004833728.1 conserved hypothetical protein [Theileria equi strain WA]